MGKPLRLRKAVSKFCYNHKLAITDAVALTREIYEAAGIDPDDYEYAEAVKKDYVILEKGEFDE